MQTLVRSKFSVFVSIDHGVWGENDHTGDKYLPVLFLCQSAWLLTLPMIIFILISLWGQKIYLLSSCMWWNLFISQPLDRGKPMATSLSSYRHGSRMKPAVWPTSCLPICNCPQSHLRSDKQGLFHVKPISLTSFPRISTSQNVLLM